MKASQLYKTALSLAGIREDEEYLISSQKADGLIFVNNVLSDLSLKTAESLVEELDIEQPLCDAAVFGIAYYISLHLSNGEKSELLSTLYSAKRAKALSKIETRQDTLPKNVRCI